MPLSTLTPPAIAAAKKRAAGDARTIMLKDAGQPGLELSIYPSGRAIWRLQCRDAAGQPRRFTLGDYPGLGLGRAREACRSMRERVRQGADPIADARGRREAARRVHDGSNTLGGLIAAFERQQGGKLKSWPEYRRRIENVFARHLKRPLDALDLPALQRTADDWPSAQSASAAVRYLRPILKWAAHPGRARVARELVLLAPPAKPQRRQRVLDGEELARLLPVLRASPSAYAAALQFMLLTACRREEAGAARWCDVDLAARLWRIPSSKSGREHLVPLSAQAIAVLHSRMPADLAPDPDALVFTSDGTRLANWDRATKAFMAESGTAAWHRHDLRRTAATMLGRLGIRRDLIEQTLNHAHPGGQLAGVYNLATYQGEVRQALDQLGARVDVIAVGGQVIPIPQAPPHLPKRRRLPIRQ